MKPRCERAGYRHCRHSVQDVDFDPAERLGGHDDADVWAATRRDGRFRITQDLDSDAHRDGLGFTVMDAPNP
jgi:hypothetical protein